MADYSTLRNQFHQDGVVFLKGAFDVASMRLALEAYEWSLAHPSRNACDFSQAVPGRFYQDLANPKATAAYMRLLNESPASAIVSQLWGGENVWFMYEQVFLKTNGEGRRTPWHQDSSYLPVEGDQLAVMWISFDPVAREDSLEFVRGSHRGILYNGSSFDPADDTAPLYPDGRLPRLPNIEAERKHWDIVSWAVEPGDVIVFHPAMLHGGAPTHNGATRRTLSLRFFGGDAKYVSRSIFEDSSPDTKRGPREVPDGEETAFATLSGRLRIGEPFRHPAFPRIRP
jgi:hypothetical protein